MCPNQNEEDEGETSKEDGVTAIQAEGESDVEGSQVSLPRSYTLPREFKYNNTVGVVKERGEREHRGSNRLPPSRFYLPSTNSSDDGKSF